MAESIQCNFCGQPATIIDASDEEHMVFFCNRCFSVTKTCGACVKSIQCDFETNPSPLPKQVQKTVRQGNMIVQTVVKNEERVRETCRKNCACFHEDFGCLRENGVCANYEEVKP